MVQSLRLKGLFTSQGHQKKGGEFPGVERSIKAFAIVQQLFKNQNRQKNPQG